MRVLTIILSLAVFACGGGDDSSPPIDAPIQIDGPAVCPGGAVGYLGECTDGTQCGAPCQCHSFGHTMRCTTTCTDPGPACPAPSPGCTGGFCRP